MGAYARKLAKQGKTVEPPAPSGGGAYARKVAKIERVTTMRTNSQARYPDDVQAPLTPKAVSVIAKNPNNIVDSQVRQRLALANQAFQNKQPMVTTPVQQPVKQPTPQPTTVKMPIRTQSVRTEPASTQKKKIGGPQYEPATTPVSTYVPKAPILSTQGGGIGIKPSPELSVVAHAPQNPLTQLTGSMANRFMNNPQNRSVVQSAPAQFIDKNLRAGTSALASGVTNVGAGIAQFSDQLMSKARTLPLSTLPKFVQTPSTQVVVQDESVAGQQRRSNVRAGVEIQNATVQKNLNVTDKQTQGMGYGILSSIPQMATLFVPGGQVAFFSSAAGNYASQAEKNGATPDKALAYGLIGGATELATEKIFFLLPQSVRKVGQGLVSRILKAGGGEGLQETITGPIMNTAEKFIYNPDKKWLGADGVVNPEQMGKDALAGAIMGVLFMGLASSNATVKQKAQTAVTEAQTSGVGVPIEVVQNIANDIKTLNADVEGTSVSITVPAPKKVKVQPPTSTRTIDVVMKEPKATGKLAEAMSKFHQKIVDTKSPILKVSKEAYDAAMNTNLVGGTVDYAINGYLPDMQGNKIGDSFASLAKDVSQNKEFATYMLDRHNIDRFREGKPIDPGMDVAASQAAVNATETLHPEWKNKADGVVNWIDTMMQEWGVKSGLIDATTYAEWRNTYPSYVPTFREFTELEKEFTGQGAAKRFVDMPSPVKKATGSDRDVSNPIGNIMEMTNKVVRTARYNQVGQELLNTVRTNPTQTRQWAEEISAPAAFTRVPDNIVTVWENGTPTYLQINNKALLDVMVGLPKIINNAPAFRAVTGVLKSLITNKNPLFAIRNIARDIPTAYVYGQQSNPLMFGVNLVVAGGQLVTNAEAAKRYAALGGTGGGLFSSSTARQYAKGFNQSQFSKFMGAPIRFIEMFNQITEQAPRLSEFNYVLDKTGDVNKALRAAQEVTVNFSRGGETTKSLEAYVPYLNASVQGIDKFLRAFSTPGFIGRMAKAGLIVTAPQIISFLLCTLNDDDKKAYANLDQRTKDTYYVFPKGDGTFIKIPKPRELGVLFGSLAERALSGVGIKGFGNTFMQNFFPVNPLSQNFLAPVIRNLPSNKDFAQRPIEPAWMEMNGMSPKLRQDENTSEIAKGIGTIDILGKALSDRTGLSPIQIDYLVRSYTGVIGQILLPATTERVGTAGVVNKVLTQSFISDPAFSSQRVTDFYNKLDELKTVRADKNIIENIPSKDLTPEEEMYNAFNALSTIASDTSKYAKTLKGDDPKIRAIREINNEYMGMAVKATTAKELKTIKTAWEKEWNKAK